MFEDFSFSSPSSSRPPRLAADDDKLMTDGDAMISPMSSRCPSPRSCPTPRFPRSRSLYFRPPQQQPLPQQAPTSVPFSAYDSRRLSIGTLTKKLHEHSLQTSCEAQMPPSPTSPPRSSHSNSSSRINSHFPGYVLTPPDTDHDDEGYASPISPSTSLSPTPQSPSLMPCPTSAPLELPFPDADFSVPQFQLPDYTTRRTHRQTISRLQGQYQYSPSDIEAIRRALLSAADEEMRRCNPLTTESCHPSSLPPAQEKRRRRTVSMQRSRVRSPVSPEPSLGPGYGHSSGSGVGDTQMRRKSMTTTTGMSGTSSSRIEKHYYSSVERERERGRKKSEAGLRRKSVVSAALASMIESEDLC